MNLNLKALTYAPQIRQGTISLHPISRWLKKSPEYLIFHVTARQCREFLLEKDTPNQFLFVQMEEHQIFATWHQSNLNEGAQIHIVYC